MATPAGAPLPGPGHILCTRSPGRGSRAIRLGAALLDKPNLSNHVALIHHRDAKGTVWAIEGKPGGVGWRDASNYLKDKHTIHNGAQPIAKAAAEIICGTMEELIGTDYDWEAITADAAASFGITLPGWDPTWHGTIPGQVVCSSSAAYGYAKGKTAHPAGGRGVTPANWLEFIWARGWEAGTLEWKAA